MRKIPAGAEASNILVGEVDFLDKTLSAFIRLSQAGIMGDLTEVPVPTRFIFVLLGPMVRNRAAMPPNRPANREIIRPKRDCDPLASARRVSFRDRNTQSSPAIPTL